MRDRHRGNPGRRVPRGNRGSLKLGAVTWAVASIIEPLERRLLLSTWSLQQVVDTYDAGAASLSDSSAAIADSALGLNIPLVRQTLSSALALPAKFALPFQTRP